MKTMKTEQVTVRSVTSRMIYILDESLGSPSVKAILARLRNSVGKPLSQTVEIWPFMFENLPEEFLSSRELSSKKEEAILTSLQLYALYRQGKQSISSDRNREKGYTMNIGSSLAALREDDKSVSMDRRFNALITATTYDELVYHLRQMIMLLKSKTSGETHIDFGRLAQDLYWFLIGKDEKIRLDWARSYYRTYTKNEEE